MAEDRDHYQVYYANKLWNLLPSLYRTEDTDKFASNGPLRELVNRIGEQGAILRRSIDRMWEDQSIETCDDWAIAYIGDLLATRLVASLDARGQRLDVAKTIYYRRRAGTRDILEEIASDITGWDAKVVEFFQRLSRTRHNFDPEIGQPAETPDSAGSRLLQKSQGLIGSLTNTTIGGWADLRNAYGATKTHSAFDEFFYTADVRQGKGQVGWHNIPRLGVFLWRLQSFHLENITPVAFADHEGCYTFDSTGRLFEPEQQPSGLFAASSRPFGDGWVSPEEWQLATPIKLLLLTKDLQAETQKLYAAVNLADPTRIHSNSLGIFRKPGDFYQLLSALEPNPEVVINPEYGCFKVLNQQSQEQLYVSYHYGFSSKIGAGPFDRRILGQQPTPKPNPITEIGGGNPLPDIGTIGTLLLKDSLTYNQVSHLLQIKQVTLRAQNKTRPTIRLPESSSWVFFGGENNSELVLEGLLISGGDIILSGQFQRVTFSCCTLDPGSFDTKSNSFKSADNRELIPCHLWVEGQINELILDRCIVGAIATRNQGNIEHLRLNDSIVQADSKEKALNTSSGKVKLSRCTLLGSAKVHRLEASECIFDDIVEVENTQQGCVRFSAWATGSHLPHPYESVEIPPKYPLFNSHIYGYPAYAQLQAGVDAAILSGKEGATISAGAEDGSEMGAFAREKNPIKERSLRLKYEEYMPLGLIPVIIYVT